MKKRKLILILVFLLALSVAVLALAVNLGDVFTKDELEENGLTKMYADYEGSWLKGTSLDSDGNGVPAEFYLPGGSMVYVDVDGNAYIYEWVMSDGEKKLQCMFVGEATNLTDVKPVFSGPNGSTTPQPTDVP